MRWLIVKLINLIVVLLIVTFLVAAIFTGPLAERQRNQIAIDVRNAVKDQFRYTPIVAVYADCISRSGTDAFTESVQNVTERFIANASSLNIPGLTDEQKVRVIQVIGEVFNNIVIDTVGKGERLSDSALAERTIQATVEKLKEEGIEVEPDQLKNTMESFVSKMKEECMNKIINHEIQLKIHQKGLDQPWFILSLRYTKMLLTFEPLPALQLSTQYWPYQGSRNTLYIILERLPYSITLFTTSSILTLLIAMPLALYAARRPGNIVDSAITAWSIFSVSMPWWWLAMVFIYLFTVKFHIFPSPYNPQMNWRDIGSVVRMAALPVLTVTVLSIGDTAYRIRNILLDVFNEDFVTVARAKGVPEHLVLRKHVIRPAAPPLVTIVLFAIVLSVFSGAIITELIFQWFGLGRLYWEAIEANDVPVILMLTYITTLLYLVLRFILDILYTFLDPRIKRA